MYNLDGEIKRCDLRLRSKYLGIETEIYKINNNDYIIYCESLGINFKEIESSFSNIRPVGIKVRLMESKPEYFEKIINRIELDNVVSNFEGVTITINDIKNILYSKFFNIDFKDIYENPQVRGELIIEISDKTSSNKEKELLDFLNLNITIFENFRIAKANSDKFSDKFEIKNEPLYCFTDKNLEFSTRDSILWFDNVGKIFADEFKKEDLYFYEKNKSSCFVNCSMFENINLRNNILLYDNIFCLLPLKNYFDEFLEKQNIKREELIELAYKNRIKFILTNTENRYDIDFLKEVYRNNKNCIITKRGINSIIACDIVEINKNYVLNDVTLWNEMLIICDVLEKKYHINSKEMYSILSWPIRAKVEAFNTLNFGSPLVISNFGVNNIIDLSDLEKDKRDKIDFEFSMNSNNIHIANALGATYFPSFTKDKTYSDAGVSNVIGNLLNFYRYSRNNEQLKMNNIRKINMEEKNSINLIEVKNSLSILQFDKYSSEYSTTNRLKEFLINIEQMPQNKRKEKISEYNELILRINEEASRNSPSIINYIFSVGGLIPFFNIGTVISLLSIIKSIYNDFGVSDRKKVSKIVDKLSENMHSDDEKEDIYMLSKVDRIANLKW